MHAKGRNERYKNIQIKSLEMKNKIPEMKNIQDQESRHYSTLVNLKTWKQNISKMTNRKKA